MPLPLPNLDDYDYAELVDMARSLIPSEAPQWTDHNPSDAGIVLIELFAWLTELLMYRTNQVPEASQEKFLQLLKGSDAPLGSSLATATQQTILDLRQRYRAVTEADYEWLLMNDWPSQAAQNSTAKVARVKAFANRNLSGPGGNTPGHMSLVVLPETDFGKFREDDLKAIKNYLEDRRLLTVKNHVVNPDYVTLKVTAKLYLGEGMRLEEVKKGIYILD